MSLPRITLIGLGLIGSSIGHKLKKDKRVSHISAYARTKETRSKALEIGFVDEVFDSAEDAVRDSDIIFLNTPIGVMGNIMESIAPYLKSGAIVTDVGSVKQSTIEQVVPYLPSHAYFVPVHPIAGTELSGPEAGFAELFQNRWCVFTPLPDTPAEVIGTIRGLWESMGGKIVFMDAKRHDFILAMTSHIPHLVAYNMVMTSTLLEKITHSDIIKYSAGGFRDFTRIASSDPVMWRDIFLNNKEQVLEVLESFTENLDVLKHAIMNKDGTKLEDIFRSGQSVREKIVKVGQETSAVDFGRHKT